MPKLRLIILLVGLLGLLCPSVSMAACADGGCGETFDAQLNHRWMNAPPLVAMPTLAEILVAVNREEQACKGIADVEGTYRHGSTLPYLDCIFNPLGPNGIDQLHSGETLYWGASLVNTATDEPMNYEVDSGTCPGADCELVASYCQDRVGGAWDHVAGANGRHQCRAAGGGNPTTKQECECASAPIEIMSDNALVCATWDWLGEGGTTAPAFDSFYVYLCADATCKNEKSIIIGDKFSEYISAGGGTATQGCRNLSYMDGNPPGAASGARAGVSAHRQIIMVGLEGANMGSAAGKMPMIWITGTSNRN